MNRKNLELFAGDVVTFSGLVARDYDNTVFDLTSYAVTFRAGKPGCDALFEKTATITTAASGLFSVALAEADTDELSGDYIYQCLATAGSARKTVLAGRLKVKPVVEDI